jgi:L-alanine-DL-glutamate epimerase-like enolase superfamily enzyme
LTVIGNHEIHINIRVGKYDYQPTKGYFDVPGLPGLGQELSEEAINTSVTATVK